MDLFGTAAHWFGRGGFVMYLLLLASIGAVSIIIERARYYRRKRQRFHFFIQQWRKDAAVYDVSELAVRYGKSHRVLNRLAAAACHAAENGRSVEIAIESAAQLEAAKLKRGLPLLGCLVTLAPILGLMGTVIGMIQSFSVFNLQSGGAPMAITGGVGRGPCCHGHGPWRGYHRPARSQLVWLSPRYHGHGHGADRRRPDG